MKIKVGDRVRVAIKDKRNWATGAAEILNGTPGIVSKEKTHVFPFSATSLLVQFDAPARTWWAHQTPPKAWWFDPSELEVLT
jgi:hypothetical protein